MVSADSPSFAQDREISLNFAGIMAGVNRHQQLAAAVEDRLDTLRVSLRTAAGASASFDAWKKLLSGVLPRRDALLKIEEYLGAPAGSFRRFIDHGELFEWTPLVEDRLDDLEEWRPGVDEQLSLLRRAVWLLGAAADRLEIEAAIRGWGPEQRGEPPAANGGGPTRAAGRRRGVGPR